MPELLSHKQQCCEMLTVDGVSSKVKRRMLRMSAGNELTRNNSDATAVTAKAVISRAQSPFDL